MWAFKRKTQPNSSRNDNVKTITCIPGIWTGWDEFIKLIISSSNGAYIAAGNILMNASQERYYNIDFCEPDDKMKTSFMYAGKVTGVTDAFIEVIGHHTYVIYLSGQTGSPAEAMHIALATAAVLKAGGLGVKIETAGKAFEKDHWLRLAATARLSDLYTMFVVDSLTDNSGTVFSCGMHNLGYRETIISGEEFETAVDLVSLFNIYQIVDKPTILNGQTFSAAVGSPLFRITDEPNQPYNGEEFFGNPFGMWRLTRM